MLATPKNMRVGMCVYGEEGILGACVCEGVRRWLFLICVNLQSRPEACMQFTHTVVLTP